MKERGTQKSQGFMLSCLQIALRFTDDHARTSGQVLGSTEASRKCWASQKRTCYPVVSQRTCKVAGVPPNLSCMYGLGAKCCTVACSPSYIYQRPISNEDPEMMSPWLRDSRGHNYVALSRGSSFGLCICGRKLCQS